MIADNNSGLAESSVILKAKKVIIDKSGPKNTTTKVAKLETGHVLNVPLFINEGDKLRIDTRTGDYVERAKE